MDTKNEFDLTRFKKFFLLEFTKQLIKNSAPSEILGLQIAIEKERENRIEEARGKIKERIQSREKEISAKFQERKTKEIPSIMHAPFGMFEFQKTPHMNPFKQVKLLIPESNFPVHLQYIKPVPVNKEIELGKINILIRDPMVKIIECYGPGENITVQGNMGMKRTGIILNKEEIDDIIQKFSKETKIPVQEGIFKVVAGRFIFLAIISEIVGSKFIIRKMLYREGNRQNAG